MSIESLATDTIVMSTEGDLDVYAAPEFKECLFRAIESGSGRLVIDMSGSGFIDSTGLGVLIAAAKHARGRSLTIVCGDGALAHIFGIVGLDRVFTLYATRDEAFGGASIAD